jgi:hypothetical protein
VKLTIGVRLMREAFPFLDHLASRRSNPDDRAAIHSRIIRAPWEPAYGSKSLFLEVSALKLQPRVSLTPAASMPSTI